MVLIQLRQISFEIRKLSQHYLHYFESDESRAVYTLFLHLKYVFHMRLLILVPWQTLCSLCSSITSFNLGCNKAILNLLPIDNFPHIFKIFGSSVHIIKIVGMFPDINTEKWDEICTHLANHVLVCSGSKAEVVFGLVIYEPSPSRSLNGCCSSVENFDKIVLISITCNKVFVQL